VPQFPVLAQVKDLPPPEDFDIPARDGEDAKTVTSYQLSLRIPGVRRLVEAKLGGAMRDRYSEFREGQWLACVIDVRAKTRGLGEEIRVVGLLEEGVCPLCQRDGFAGAAHPAASTVDLETGEIAPWDPEQEVGPTKGSDR
jgi:hypothetical protein